MMNVGEGCTHLVHRHDLTVGLLDLAELAKEVPESRLGDNLVGRKDAHAVKLRGGVGLAGQVTPDDLVFLKATYGCQYRSTSLTSKSPAIAIRSLLSRWGRCAVPLAVWLRIEIFGDRLRLWVSSFLNVDLLASDTQVHLFHIALSANLQHEKEQIFSQSAVVATVRIGGRIFRWEGLQLLERRGRVRRNCLPICLYVSNRDNFGEIYANAP